MRPLRFKRSPAAFASATPFSVRPGSQRRHTAHPAAPPAATPHPTPHPPPAIAFASTRTPASPHARTPTTRHTTPTQAHPTHTTPYLHVIYLATLLGKPVTFMLK